ncbi:venom metalloproteinase BumaMPs1-like [Amblyomma americanum]
MGSALLRHFSLCAIIAISSQKEFMQRSVTVYPQLYEERRDQSEKLLLINDDYSLQLRKASVLPESVLLREATGDGISDRYIGGVHLQRYLYEDKRKMASLLLKPQAEGHYDIVGLLNATHRIDPEAPTERLASGITAHRVSKITFNEGIDGVAEVEHDLREGEIMERMLKPAARRLLQQIPARTSSGYRYKRQENTPLPNNFTLELFFVSDVNHTMHFQKPEDHLEYVMLFVHSISLHLQQLSPPGFVSLAGIQRTYKNNASFVKLNNKGQVLGLETLDDFWRFAQINYAMWRSDAVLLVTPLDILGRSNGQLTSGILGYAYEKGVCTGRNLAEAEDSPGKFSGLQTAVHEIGHLLGSSHDGEKDSTKCLPKDGYMMSPHARGDRSYEFSPCSKSAISKHLQSKSSYCLRQHDTSTIASFPNLTMPVGKVLKGLDFCRAFFRDDKNVIHIQTSADNNCRFLCVFKTWKGTLSRAKISAPDGTPCSSTGEPKKCKSGLCS